MLVSNGQSVVHSSKANNSSDSDSEEETKAPNELIMEFLDCVMENDMDNAIKLCKMILIYEPANKEALQFQSLLQVKKEQDEAESSEDSDDEDSDDSSENSSESADDSNEESHSSDESEEEPAASDKDNAKSPQKMNTKNKNCTNR